MVFRKKSANISDMKQRVLQLDTGSESESRSDSDSDQLNESLWQTLPVPVVRPVMEMQDIVEVSSGNESFEGGLGFSCQ